MRKTQFEPLSKITINNPDLISHSNPITIVCSKLGWIKAIKGHNIDLSDEKFKEGDKLLASLEVMTNDKIIMFCQNGRVFTILADNVLKT